jgi:hypothetical protein
MLQTEIPNFSQSADEALVLTMDGQVIWSTVALCCLTLCKIIIPVLQRSRV